MQNKYLFLNIIYPILCIVYIISMNYTPYPAQPLIKSLPVFLLFLFTILNAKSISLFPIKGVILFSIGFLFSSFGDLALALDFPHSFVVGLGLFLIAHLFYIFSFYLFPRVNWNERKNIIFGILIIAVSLSLFIIPNAGEFAVPVLFYILVITTMACMASLQKIHYFTFIFGAVIFMASDAMIAINKFVTPIMYSGIWIMTTYYIAQGLLAKGIFQTHGKK